MGQSNVQSSFILNGLLDLLHSDDCYIFGQHIRRCSFYRLLLLLILIESGSNVLKLRRLIHRFLDQFANQYRRDFEFLCNIFAKTVRDLCGCYDRLDFVRRQVFTVPLLVLTAHGFLF